MSKFIGRRYIGGGGGDGYGTNDHSKLIHLDADDHLHYLITSSIRTVTSPTSGINKTGADAGDVFTLINAGSGAALYIRQTGTTTDADAALDIDNTGNIGRGLSVSSSTTDPSLPLVQFSALSPEFDEPVLSVTHPSKDGLAVFIDGDAYVSSQITVGEAVKIAPLGYNPVPLGEAGIYVDTYDGGPDNPGIFYFVDADGYKHTFGADLSSVEEAIHTIVKELDAYHPDITGTEHYQQHSDAIDAIIKALDGYAGDGVVHLRKRGEDADDYPFDSVFSLDGYSYPVGKDRLLVYVNGINQAPVFDYNERSTTSIEFAEQVDHNDIIDIWILPGSLASEDSVATLQGVYDNSDVKEISVYSGQILFTQTETTGSALKLKSNQSITPVLLVEQLGSGEAVRLKSVDETTSTILVQKDTVARNTIANTTIIERSTSHASGSQAGIGSAILTRLENTGTSLFSASRLVTGTESATDSAEKTYLSIELSDEGILEEKIRISSTGAVGVNTTSPDAMLHIQGDGYFSAGVEIAGQVKVHNTPCAPINVPILADTPAILGDGDVWFSDIGGERKLNIRINGATYSVLLTS